MAKEQQVIDAFFQVDEDHDGEIDYEQFSSLVEKLGLPNIYPGSVKNTIRKINYQNPDKETLNLEQAKEYISSMETAAKHDIWKKKYELLEWAAEVRKVTDNQQNGDNNETATAPGAVPFKQPDNSIQEASIRVLVGPNKPNYSAQIDIEFEKSDQGQKVKPFLKLVFSYKNSNDAKEMEEVFKSNFSQFLKLLAQDISEWTDEMDNFKINSIVQGSNVTFFITTANEEMVSLIQMFSQLLEMCFGTQVQGKAHLRYEFEYDFQQFLKNENSSFYDCFVKESRLVINTRARNIIRQIRKYFKNTSAETSLGDFFEYLFPIVFLHLDCLEADIEFDSFGSESQYQLESKQEIVEGLKESAEFLAKLQEGGMTPKTLLRLLDCDVSIDASVGEWKGKVFLKLPHLSNIFLEYMKEYEEENKEPNTNQKASPVGDFETLLGNIDNVKPKPSSIKHYSSSNSDEDIDSLGSEKHK